MVRGRPAPGGRAMKVALIDNGSLEPAAHAGLRAAAAAIGDRAGIARRGGIVEAQRPDPRRALGGAPAWTLAPWIRAQARRRASANSSSYPSS